jgi:hypothetical protein
VSKSKEAGLDLSHALKNLAIELGDRAQLQTALDANQHALSMAKGVISAQKICAWLNY